MSPLKLIILNEYKTDITAKSFWISTFIVPLICLIFGFIAGYLLIDSPAGALQESIVGTAEDENITGLQIAGMMMGFFLTIFLMMYGSQIFTKVKTEKVNRIVEVMATAVNGRTMMLAKIISVGLVGLTQLLLWGILIGVIIVGLIIVFPVDIPWSHLLAAKYIMAPVWGLLYFVGGYIFYGSLFAAVGAMTNKNNENQEYVAVLTLILLMSFYVAQYAITHSSATFVMVCSFIPLTSPTIGAVNAITQAEPIWVSFISLLTLYLCAWITLSLSGKIYTSSILLKGKRFSLSDIITFLKTK